MKLSDKARNRMKLFNSKRSSLALVDKPKSFGVAFIMLASLSFGFLGGWLGSESRENNGQNTTFSTKADQQIVLNESQLISDIATSVGASVVSVDVISQAERTDFFGRSRSFEQQSAGTGIIISDDGYVVTNRHVVDEGSTEVSLTLSDGTILDDVTIVGRTAASDPLDIAFLKINDTKGKKLSVAKLGDSGTVRVGDKVIAIGNALGQFQNTVTAGIISGYGRSVEAGGNSGESVETLQNLFQTDASINEGNSGGPLVNINGEVIGINTAVAGAGAENVGFAIPINDIQGLVKSVIKTGKLERPYLGVRYVTLTDQYAAEYELETKRGAYIVPSANGQSSIINDSPAAKAGLKEGDVITKVDGMLIDERNSLVSLVSRKAVGETVDLTVVRDNREQKITVTLEAFREQ